MPKPRTRKVVLTLDMGIAYHRKIVVGVASYAHGLADWSLYVEVDPLAKLPDFGTWRADGIISSFDNRKVCTAIAKLKIPVVGIEGMYGWRDPDFHVPYFACDNRAIGRLAAEDLIARGFTQLAFCGVPKTRMTGWSQVRAEAFAERAQAAGLPCSIFTGRYATARKWAELQRELSDWLAPLPKPLGLMACYDARARHVLEACRALELRVPEDVSVIGVDNDEMMCELTAPPLSSIDQGARTLGYRAAELLDRLMDGEKTPATEVAVEPEGIVTRRSSDVLAVNDADVAAAVRFIQQHASEGIRVPDVVRAVHVSRSTLEGRFKAVMRRTIHSEIQRVQVSRAKQLAVTTDLPLKQVAIKAGFSSVQYMTTVFRKLTGHTPHELRRRSQA